MRGVALGDVVYPLDENEKFYVDGSSNPSLQFMGLEDSFGFSWGFPEKSSQFPYTGWHIYYQGAFAYRFFVNDAIDFHKSLRVAIDFGPHDDPSFRKIYSQPDDTLQLSFILLLVPDGATSSMVHYFGMDGLNMPDGIHVFSMDGVNVQDVIHVLAWMD